MAKLTGVKSIGVREIEYGGARYKESGGPPQVGDILRNEGDYSFLTLGAYYLAEKDEDGEVYAWTDTQTKDYEVDCNYTIFRRVESTPQSPTEIRAAIEKKRAEIAELESLITVGVGDYVRVVGETYNGELSEGTIGRVDRTDHSAVPYHVVAVFGDCEDWADTDAVEKLTPADAKAALIAHIEEAFKSEVSA
ncbi:hypothetical protein [uncultured Paenibacillus sp.]|uniref:hypothetical protein n=1 Tax=uncultured Paenibacillus sp. TaxID=227322 RepID=UPI0015B12A8B|nr:hypothetical protein [uncultured Paenibacillus sp.]DAW22624.1 MAG TPA: hypothetical protein [Caudoviricetes sp.]